MPNLHPMLVHFPIGLLTIYALLECLRFKRLLQLPYWFYVKAVLAIIGTLASYPTFLSGKLIEPLFQNNGVTTPLVLRHSQFAFFTIILFTLIMLAYLFGWIKREGWGVMATGFRKRVRDAGIRYADAVLGSFASPVLAALGLFCITVTGALGGSIVYGPDVDPFVQAIYGAFGPK